MISQRIAKISNHINTAIDWAVAHHIHVVYIQYEYLSACTKNFKPNTHGAKFASEMKIASRNSFTKCKGNALRSEEFTDFIRKNEIGDFYLDGSDAALCVKSTCYNFCKASYNVHILSDCITSYDKRKIDEILHYYESKDSKITCLSDLLPNRSFE